MEKVPGVQLDFVWAGMGIEDRLTIAKAIARYQKTWTSFSFKKFGSLYYAKDLDGHNQSPLYTDCHGVTITNPRFAVGPSTGRDFSDDGRLAVEFDRGPCKTGVPNLMPTIDIILGNNLEAYQSAIGHREIACVRSLPRLPKSPVTLCGPGIYRPTREKKLRAIQCYLTMIKYLLPTDQSIQSSCLWHSDLHVENIFVNPKDPTEIVGIIDWQSTELAPLFYHARQPYFLDYDGPPTLGLERPRLPENLAQLDPAAQRQAKALYLNRSLSALYKTLLHRQNPPLYRALAFRETSSFDLLLLARNLLVDGEATYLAQVVELEKIWAELPGVCTRGAAPFPFQFSNEDKAEIQADVSGALRGIEAMREVQETLGELFPERGIVREEQYEEARDALRQIKEQVLETFARDESDRGIWREVWPFDD